MIVEVDMMENKNRPCRSPMVLKESTEYGVCVSILDACFQCEAVSNSRHGGNSTSLEGFT